MTPEERSYFTLHFTELRREMSNAHKFHKAQLAALLKRNQYLAKTNARLRAEAKLDMKLKLLIRELRKVSEAIEEFIDKPKPPTAAEEALVNMDFQFSKYRQ